MVAIRNPIHPQIRILPVSQLVPPVPHGYQKRQQMCAVIVEPSNCGIPHWILVAEFTILKMQPDYMAVREILDFVP